MSFTTASAGFLAALGADFGLEGLGLIFVPYVTTTRPNPSVIRNPIFWPKALTPNNGNIQLLLDGAMTARLIALLLITKAVVWLVALGSGTSGGVLAPLLILGVSLGCWSAWKWIGRQ